jgi:hypothetical protein
MDGAQSTQGEINAYKTSVVKPEEKRSLRRPRHRWEDNNRMDLRETEWEGVEWMYLAQVRDQWQSLANRVTNLRVP